MPLIQPSFKWTDERLKLGLVPVLTVYLIITAFGFTDLLGHLEEATYNFLGLGRSFVMQAVYVPLYLAAVGLLALRWLANPPRLNASVFMWGLVAFAVLSITWSYLPLVSIKRAFALLGMTALASLAVSYVSVERYTSLVVSVTFLVLLATFITVLAWPDISVHSDGAHLGRWRGLFRHKNTLGNFLAFSTPFVLGTLLLGARSIKLAIFPCIVLLLTIVVLYQVGSATSWLMMIGGGAGVLAALSLRFTPLRIWQLSILILIALILIFVFRDNLFQLLGRSATLTGRTKIWADLLPVIKEQWLGGYGYLAFWESARQDIIVFDSAWVRHVRFSHNGFFELVLSLGVVGLVAFSGVLVAFLWQLLRYFQVGSGLVFVVCIGYLVTFLIHNLAESSIVEMGSLHWFNFCVLFFYVTRQGNYLQENTPLITT